MICPYCKKEFSDSVYKLHIQRCPKKPKPVVIEEIKEEVKTTKKKGK